MKLKRFVLEVVVDESYFEPDYGKRRRVFRYRAMSKFFLIKAKNLENARKIADRIDNKFGAQRVTDGRLYEQVKRLR